MTLQDLPALNATLNSLAAGLLVAAYVCIRRKLIRAHGWLMVSAVATSAAFLVSYLTYHFNVPGVTRFPDHWFRPIYLGILLTHTVLAAVILPLVIVTVVFAIRGKFERHRKVARWTWPLWMYVSVTGVLIYLLLYQGFARSAG